MQRRSIKTSDEMPLKIKVGSPKEGAAMGTTFWTLALALAVVTCYTSCVAEAASASDACSAFIYPGPDDVDIKFAAIYGIHSSNETGCSAQPGLTAVQIALAMQWAVSLLNGDNSTGSFIPGVKIGLDVYDDCNQEYLAARHTGSIAAQSSMGQPAQCSLDQRSTPQQDIPVAGIIGTTRSQTTTMVTRVARSTNIPVVGLAATLAELSDKTKYPGFVRTMPSDVLQAQAIIDLALEFQWSYIVGIFSNDNYGQMGMERLQALAVEHRICVSAVTSVDILGQLDQDGLEIFLRVTLSSKVESSNGTLGVVYFGQHDGLTHLLRLARVWASMWLDVGHVLDSVHWVVSDAVILGSDLIDLVLDQTRIAGVGMVTAELASFRDFELGLLTSPPDWVKGDKWREALGVLATARYGCESYNLSSGLPAGCSWGGSSLYSGYLAAALDSVYLLANTLRNVQSELCKGQPGLCESFREVLEEGLLASYNLSQFSYTDLPASHVPTEFGVSGRALVPDGGDFLVRNQSCYDIKFKYDSADEFVSIGSYTLDGVDLLPEASSIMPASGCRRVCEECQDLGAKSYEFVDGDYVILGIFSVHWKGKDASFKCGEFRENSDSFPAMKAFVHAVEKLRADTGIRFGYVAIDDCYSPLTATRMISKIMSGDLEVICKHTHVPLDPKKVVVGVGAQSSPVTIAVLPLLQNLDIPLISF
ncbi:hypothetical protein EGW08_016274, partial [Elysia chlorotica]